MAKIKIQKKDIWIDDDAASVFLHVDFNILDTGTSISHRA